MQIQGLNINIEEWYVLFNNIERSFSFTVDVLLLKSLLLNMHTVASML